MDFYPLHEILEINMVNLSLIQRMLKINGWCNNFAKIAGKKIIHKSAEATVDLIGNKIADKTTSMGKPRSKKRKR